MTGTIPITAAISFATKAPVEIVEGLDLDLPRDSEALVRITHAGVCHSDLNDIDGVGPLSPPFVMGHEAAGVIEHLGGPSQEFAVGDRVVISMRAPCDNCFYCNHGQPVLCETSHIPPGTGEIRLRYKGEPVTRGMNIAGFASHVTVPLRGLTRVPDDVALSHAAVCGCAFQTATGSVTNIADCDQTTRACVIGLGGIGQAMVMALKAIGARQIVGIDPVADRRAQAESFGADLTLAPGDDLVGTLLKATDGRGFDTVFDNVARTTTTRDGLALTRSGGELVLIGVVAPPEQPGFTTLDMVMRQKRVTGVFLGNCHPKQDMPMILEQVQSGALPLGRLITDTLPLERINDALDLMRKGQGVRTILTMD